MHHQDRGSQYCSKAYRPLQTSYKMQLSIRERTLSSTKGANHLVCNKGDCWEFALSKHLHTMQSSHKAPMESFFGTLKTECLHHYKFKTRVDAKRVTFEYIEVFYNQNRGHAKLNNQATAAFAKTNHQNLKENTA